VTEQETHQKKVAAHFDDWADHYDDSRMGGWFRYFQSKIIDAVNPQSGQHILDVGCGTGWAVKEIVRRVPGARAYGIDISSEMIKIASEGPQSDAVEFNQGDSEKLHYDENFFDAVICSSSFHHYPQPVASLSEIRRVLKPRASLYLLETCRDGFKLIILHDLLQKTFRNDHIRYYSTGELIRFLEMAGFQEISEILRDQGLFRHGKLITSEVLLRATKKE
jgi:ubiquinone/menaquinone biosynthesis C-methylase UbiE